MSSDFLSQEEIDALLSRAGDDAVDEFGDEDKDLLGEIGNICMGSAATTLSILINQPVSITTPKVELSTLAKLKESFTVPNVAIEVKFIDGLAGANLLVLKLTDAGIIANLMMGGPGQFTGTELTEIEMSAVSESMNQMIGTAATSMATMFKREVNISPPDALVWQDTSSKLSNMIDENERIVRVSFHLTIGNMVDSEIMQLYPISTAKEIIESMTSSYKEPAAAPKAQEPAPAPLPKQDMGYVQEEPQTEVNESYTNNVPVQEVPVQRAEFTQFEKRQAPPSQPRNIDLIMDVPIEVSVILGRTRKTIKEILELTNGSLIELDKFVEEPVEILVNGKMVAQGEVVVVNENFGVRITSIVSNVERVKGLKNSK